VCGDCGPFAECIAGWCYEAKEECDDGNIVPWDGCTAGRISEVRVNLYGPDDQQAPCVAGFEAGGFVVAWASAGQDGNGAGGFLQTFGPSGNRIGQESEANKWETGNQGLAMECGPRTATFGDGRFVLVWASQNQDSNGYGIFAQLFSTEGVAFGGEHMANSTVVGNQVCPDVATLPDGRFVVVWEGPGAEGDQSDVFGRIYTGGGMAEGEEFGVAATAAGKQHHPAVAASSNGTFTVAYAEFPDESPNEGVSSRTFQSGGAATRGG